MTAVSEAIAEAVDVAMDAAMTEPEFVRACAEAYKAEMDRRTRATAAQIYGAKQ